MPETLPPPPDAPQRLALIGAFALLAPDARIELAAEIGWLRYRGGEVLFRQDDPADAAYFIVRGRVRVTQRGDAEEHTVGERGVGEPIGEVGVIAGVTRTATVRAIRDTDVVRIDRTTFDRLLRESPATMVPLIGVVAARLAEALRGPGTTRRPVSTVAAVRADESGAGAAAIDGIVAALAARADVVRVRLDEETDDGATIDARLAALIDEHEGRGGVVLLEVRATNTALVGLALRQADCVLVVADPAPRPLGAEVRAAIDELEESGCSPIRMLVLVQPQWRSRPLSTAPRIVGFDEHFHLRVGSASDCARIARHLTGDAVGLVLGGGGARAMSHVGAYRALVEDGVPIDRIGGSSIGGVIAAQIAAGWSPDELFTRNREEWPAARLGRRLTVPLLSLLSPEPAISMLERMFGKSDLEDLWLPCFVTAVDLTACRLVVARRGPARQWVLATQSPPGIWPPVVGNAGELYADGAIIDNLPVLPMREQGAGRVVAISVSRRPAFGAGTAIEVAPSPFGFARNLARSPAERAERSFPNLIQVLYRTALVTGLERHAPSEAATDVYVEPEVEEFAISDYARIDAIVGRGYDAMRRALDAQPDLATAWS